MRQNISHVVDAFRKMPEIVDEITLWGVLDSRIKQRYIKADGTHSLINITIQDSEPPTQEVMEAFKAVETAKQGKETALNNAEKYRNEKIPEAEAQVDKIKQQAESTKQSRINEANAEVAKFNAMYEEYIKNPEVTKKRLFYETMEELLPDLKVVIDGSDGNMMTILPLDSSYNLKDSVEQSQTKEDETSEENTEG